MVTVRESAVHSEAMAAILRELIEAIEADPSTYYALAKKAGLPLPTLRRLVLGKFGTVSLETAEKLAAALGLELRLEKQRRPRSSSGKPPAAPATTEESHGTTSPRTRKPRTRAPRLKG